MKICLIITGLGMGGAETQVTSLADKFTLHGHKVMLIFLTGEALVKPITPDVRIEGMDMKKNIGSFIGSYIKVRRLIKKYKPDVVHSHMVHANLFARLMRLSVKIPRLICTAHSTNEGGKIRMWAYRLTDWLADISTNVSQEAVDRFVENGAVPRSKMITVHNGIDTDIFQYNANERYRIRNLLNITETTRVLLAVGRFTEAKDYPNLLNAFAKVQAARDDCILWIAGTGPLEEHLKSMVVDLELESKVFFLGIRSDITSLMSAADIFVLSSAWEGFALVVAEAMACERMVVATDCGGVREVVGDCSTLVPPCNDKELANAILQSLDCNEDERKEIGHNARRRIVDFYSLESTVARWLKIYCMGSD